MREVLAIAVVISLIVYFVDLRLENHHLIDSSQALSWKMLMLIFAIIFVIGKIFGVL